MNTPEEINKLTRDELVERFARYGHHVFPNATVEDMRDALIAFTEFTDKWADEQFGTANK
jgi:hypothetical protein